MSLFSGWRGVLMALGVCTTQAVCADVPAMKSGNGLTVVSQKRVDGQTGRLIEVQLSTAALPGLTKVRILVPADYSLTSATEYPVLYLMHGTGGSAADWTTSGNAASVTANSELIVVMPDIGLSGATGGGYCTDWPDGLYRWETYHIEQLLPWIEANLRTKADAGRGQRAIAGLSQGGFCSTSYGARYPDLFGTVLSFSGAVDIAHDADAVALMVPVINVTETLLDRVSVNSMFGDPGKNWINWAAHDPTTLAGNLAKTHLFEFFGNGQAGPLDSPPYVGTPVSVPGELLEGGVHLLNVDFHKRLAALGVANSYSDYGPGTHSWPYWNRDLQQSIGPLMSIFAANEAPPSAITYASGDDTYSVYGWKVKMNRQVREFSTLSGASCAGFALSGSGSGTVVTPPCYAPGALYTVSLNGSHLVESSVVAADSNGRLTVTVPLGPSNLFQQFTLEADLLGTKVYTTAVGIKAF